MDDGGPELTVRASRRREEASSGRLSVADLLARHGAEGGAPSRRSSHRLRDEPDQVDQAVDTGSPRSTGPPEADIAESAEPVAPELPEPASSTENDHLKNDHFGGADRHPRRALDELLAGYDRSLGLPRDEQGHTEQLFPKGTIEQTGSMRTALDQIALPSVVEYGQPTEKTKPAGPPTGRFTQHSPAPLFTDPSENVRPPARDDGAPTEVIPETAPPAIDTGYYDIKADRDYSDADYYGDERLDPPGNRDVIDRPVDTEVAEPDEVPDPASNAPVSDLPVPDDPATDTDDTADDRDAWAKGTVADRTAHIDQTLSRLTAIHAGLSDDVTDRVSGSTRLPPLVKSLTRRSTSSSRHGGETRRSSGSDLGGGESRRFAIGHRTKMIALTVAAALLLVVGAGFGANVWLNGKLHTVDALDPAAPGVIDAAAQSGDQNYLVVLADPADHQAPESNVSNGAETVLLAHVPAGQDRAVLLSAPANLLVDRPGCERYDAASVSYSGAVVPAQSDVALASAYFKGGPKCIVAQLQQLTGLAINHFMSLNLASVRDMVDAENGLVTCVPRPVVDDSLGVVVPNGGKQVLGGDAALSYARAWHVRGEAEGAGQLAGQALRQRLLLSALLAQVDTAPLLHLPTLASVAGVLGADSLVDGVTLGSLGQLSDALRRIDPAKIDFADLPTTGRPDAQGNEVLSAGAAKSLFDAIRADRPLPGEGANASAPSTANTANTTGLPPSQVTVAVRNGSSHSGLANDAASSLRGLGFQVSGVGDAEHQAGGRTIINASSDQAAQAAALSQAVPDAQVQTVSGTGTLELVLGDSFDGQVTAAPAPPAPPLLTAAQLTCR